MPEMLYAIVMRPDGEVVEVGFTEQQAKHYCTTFNRVMKEDNTRAEMVKLLVSLPTDDPAREQSR